MGAAKNFDINTTRVDINRDVSDAFVLATKVGTQLELKQLPMSPLFKPAFEQCQRGRVLVACAPDALAIFTPPPPAIRKSPYHEHKDFEKLE